MSGADRWLAGLQAVPAADEIAAVRETVEHPLSAAPPPDVDQNDDQTRGDQTRGDQTRGDQVRSASDEPVYPDGGPVRYRRQNPRVTSS
jgi:hypothetical protein